MGIFGKIFSNQNTKNRFRILFATDLHGSNTCYKKFINTINNKKIAPDALIIGGDITGKDLVFIVKQKDGSFLSTDRGKTIKLKEFQETVDFEKRVSDSGSYIYRCNIVEYKTIIANKEKQDKLLKRLIEQRVQEWVDLADNKFSDSHIPIIMNTGNDDFFSIDDIIKKSKKIIFPEGKTIELNDTIKLISCGFANITPFSCPRDIPEHQLFDKIESYIDNDLNMENCIFNLHCPPKNTKLDIGPKLIEGTKPVLSALGKETDAVGSTAVREILTKYQPLLGLHGHIHESTGIDSITNTVIVNPGSEYQSGILKFAIIDIVNGIVKNTFIRTAM